MIDIKKILSEPYSKELGLLIQGLSGWELILLFGEMQSTDVNSFIDFGVYYKVMAIVKGLKRHNYRCLIKNNSKDLIDIVSICNSKFAKEFASQFNCSNFKDKSKVANYLTHRGELLKLQNSKLERIVKDNHVMSLHEKILLTLYYF